MTAHSSILAWRIPWTAEPGGAIVQGGHKGFFSKITLALCMALASASFWLFFFFLIPSLRENVVSYIVFFAFIIPSRIQNFNHTIWSNTFLFTWKCFGALFFYLSVKSLFHSYLPSSSHLMLFYLNFRLSSFWFISFSAWSHTHYSLRKGKYWMIIMSENFFFCC